MRTKAILALLVLCGVTASARVYRTGLNLAAPKQIGVASWYGRREQGKTMANGKPFDRNRYTCASRTYKLGTRLLVSYPEIGTFVQVVVTDRGPWIEGRVLDLSERAALTLGLRPHGVGLVIIEPVHLPN
jgi:rare lipoprotein A